jgi:hypothetical protein
VEKAENVSGGIFPYKSYRPHIEQLNVE